MDKTNEFINNAMIDDIPWNRLATTYGRATDFPVHFQTLLDSETQKVKKSLKELILNVEHQSTLWPASPFAMIFLVRIFDKAFSNMSREINLYIVENLIILFADVAESCTMNGEMEYAEQLPLFQDMLKEEYLWSEEYDEEEDEARYLEDVGPFPDNLAYSFYYYSYQVLKTFKSRSPRYTNCNNAEIASKIKQLTSMIN